MADDVILNAGSGGDTVAADDIGPGVKYQRVKVTLGADGVTDGDVSATNPIPTDLQEIDGVAVAPAQTDDGSIAGALVHQAVVGLHYGWDGTNWARCLQIDPEDDAIGGGVNRVVGVGLNYGWDGANWERIATKGRGALTVEGVDALDAAVTVNPILVGAQAYAAAQSPVDEGDAVPLWTDRQRRLVVATDHDEDSGNSSTTPLGISGQFVGTSFAASSNFSLLLIQVFADEVGTLSVQHSTDNSNWDVQRQFAIEADVGEMFRVPIIGKYYRLVYQNGATAQTIFRLVTYRHRHGSAVDVWDEDDSIPAGKAHPVNVGLLYGYDGSNWERLETDASGHLRVIDIDKVKDDDDDSVASGQTGIPLGIGLTYGWNSTSWVRLRTGNNDPGCLMIIGARDFDSPIGNRPLTFGGRASNTEPTAMSADGDVVHAWLTREGSQVVAGFDGTNPQHILTSAAGRLSVDINSGAGGPTDTDDDDIAGGQSAVLGVGLNYGWDGAGWQRLLTDAGGSLLTVSLVKGVEAHDAPALSNPVLIGGYASSSTPTGVSADGDLAHLWCDGVGRLHVAGQIQHDSVAEGNPVLIGGRSAALASGISLVSADGDATNLAVDRRGIVFARLVDNQGDELADAGANSLKVSVISNPGSAHDALVTGNPVRIAGKSNDNEPTAVSGDGDTVDLWADRLGRVITVAGHPSPELPVVVNATASGDTQVIAAPGAGVSLYIKRVVINNGGASVNAVQLQENGSAVNRGGGDLAADGGGMVLDYGDRGWKLTANTALEVNLGSAGDVWVSVLEHYIAA